MCVRTKCPLILRGWIKWSALYLISVVWQLGRNPAGDKWRLYHLRRFELLSTTKIKNLALIFSYSLNCCYNSQPKRVYREYNQEN